MRASVTDRTTARSEHIGISAFLLVPQYMNDVYNTCL